MTMTLHVPSCAPIEALRRAEAFITGFEGDDAQEGVDQLLKELRDAIERAQADTFRADMIAVLHIARAEILRAARQAIDRQDRQPGEYPALMLASQHITRALAKAEGMP